MYAQKVKKNDVKMEPAYIGCTIAAAVLILAGILVWLFTSAGPALVYTGVLFMGVTLALFLTIGDETNEPIDKEPEPVEPPVCRFLTYPRGSNCIAFGSNPTQGWSAADTSVIGTYQDDGSDIPMVRLQDSTAVSEFSAWKNMALVVSELQDGLEIVLSGSVAKIQEEKELASIAVNNGIILSNISDSYPLEAKIGSTAAFLFLNASENLYVFVIEPNSNTPILISVTSLAKLFNEFEGSYELSSGNLVVKSTSATSAYIVENYPQPVSTCIGTNVFDGDTCQSRNESFINEVTESADGDIETVSSLPQGNMQMFFSLKATSLQILLQQLEVGQTGTIQMYLSIEPGNDTGTLFSLTFFGDDQTGPPVAFFPLFSISQSTSLTLQLTRTSLTNFTASIDDQIIDDFSIPSDEQITIILDYGSGKYMSFVSWKS